MSKLARFLFRVLGLSAGGVLPAGFQRWAGGECPVAANTRVEVVFRNHNRHECEAWELADKNAHYSNWAHSACEPQWDIVGYREIASA